MALILPQKNTGSSSGSSKLVLPGTPESKRKIERAGIDREARYTAKASKKEAERSFTSRFAEELGFAAAEVVRSPIRFGAAGLQALKEGSVDAEVTPGKRGFKKTIEFLTGTDQPFSLRGETNYVGDLLEKVGLSKETAGKASLPIGIGLGLFDFTPLGKGKGAAFKRATETIAKSTDELVIANTLRTVTKGDEAAIKQMSAQLKNVTDPLEVERIVTQAVESTQSLPSVAIPTKAAKPTALDALGKRIMGVEPPRKIARAEVSLLRSRISNLNKLGQAEKRGVKAGEKAGARTALDSAKRIQTDVIRLIRENLPVPLRGRLLTAVRDANKVSKLDAVLERVTKDFQKYEEVAEASRELSTRRQKEGFLKKIAELNQTAIRDIKKTVGINKPIRSMNVTELDQMIAETKNRLNFKRERGLIGERVAKSSPERISEEAVQEILLKKKNPLQKVKEGFKGFAAEASGDFFKVLSTELREIDPSIRNAIVEMERQASTHTFKGHQVLEKITTKLKDSKITREDYVRLDYAIKNNASGTIADIAEKYGLTAEFKELRTVFDDVLERAQDVDIDIARRENYFSRSLKTDKVSRQRAQEVFNRDGLVQQGFEDFQKKMGRLPTEAERWKIINNLIRGFRTNNIALSKTGSMKSRVLDEVTPDLEDLYEDSFTAMRKYFDSTNSLIEARRFFGKQLGSDLKKIDPDADLSGMVAVYIDKLMASGKLADPQKQLRLRELLEARFTGGEMNKILQMGKQVGYFTIMGDVFSALTQIGDLMPALYQAGFRSSTTALLRNLLRRDSQALTLKDFGLERIAAEFKTGDGMASAVDKVFKLSGLSRIDAMGKETFLNGIWDSYKRRIDDPALVARIQDQMGELADATLNDIRAGNLTENVKQLMFSELSNFYPVTLSEVPVTYLRNPNGRIFYQMKTYTMKQLDIYRREIVQQMRTNPMQGLQNMTRLVGLLVVLNASSDEIKNFIKGKDVDFRDKVIDNALKLIGFSRYTVDQVGQQGIGRTISEQILPPTQVFDDLSRDALDVLQGKETAGLRSTRNIPVGGELYYWWAGRGSVLNEKTSSRSSGSSVEGIPSVSLPEIEIPSVTIPSI